MDDMLLRLRMLEIIFLLGNVKELMLEILQHVNHVKTTGHIKLRLLHHVLTTTERVMINSIKENLETFMRIP
jgi:hypothetical protein